MEDFRGGLDKLKEEGRVLRQEVRERTVGYITAALGLVAGLAWNDAVRALIERFFPMNQQAIWAKFIYAALVTLAVVVLALALMRWVGKKDKEDA